LDNIIDTVFEEVSRAVEEDTQINGEPLYYNTIQVASILGENDSTIRYWAKAFNSILSIKISNKMKRYTKDDIDKMKFIRHLIRTDGLTIKQVEEYCSQKGFDDKTGILDVNNPLAVKTFISGLTDEMDKKFIEIQNTIIKQQQDMISYLQEIIISNNLSLKEDIINTVDEVISDKMNGYFDNLQNELSITQNTNKRVEEKLETQSQQIQTNLENMSNKIIEENTKAMNEFKCLTLEQIEQQSHPKSFISKIFNFKK
jgi:DNA-binding transcriptional MerR regulator